MNKRQKLIVQFMKFSIVGLSNTFISYAVYALLTYIGVPYLISSIISFIVGVLNSFFWNNRYVFKKQDDEKRNLFEALFKTFLAYAGTGLILSNILLVLFIEVLNVSKYIAPFFSLVFTVPSNFLLNKFWTFKEK